MKMSTKAKLERYLRGRGVCIHVFVFRQTSVIINNTCYLLIEINRACMSCFMESKWKVTDACR